MKPDPLFSQLYSVVNQMLPLKDKEWNAFADILVYRQVPKKFSLLRTGDIAREAYFVNKGATRLFFEKDGDEISANFMFENSFITSMESWLLQTPSRQAIDTLEDSELLVLKKHRLVELTTAFPVFHLFSKAIAEMGVVMIQRRASSFILDSPEERYMSMLQQRPEILERVPQHMIASYLGVTPVSLSRIRKRIS